jgi:hypothetical protein
LNLSSGVQNEFSSLFASIEKEFEKISKRTASGKINIIDANGAEKALERIDNLYAMLSRKMEAKGIATAGLKED